jgi:hypothetical protein
MMREEIQRYKVIVDFPHARICFLYNIGDKSKLMIYNLIISSKTNLALCTKYLSL